MKATWSLNGRMLRSWRLAAGLSHEDLCDAMGKTEDSQPRILMGVEKNYRRFETEGQANRFLKRYHAACLAAYELRKAAAPEQPDHEAKA